MAEKALPACFTLLRQTEDWIYGTVDNSEDLQAVLDAFQKYFMVTFVEWAQRKEFQMGGHTRRLKWIDVLDQENLIPCSVESQITKRCSYGGQPRKPRKKGQEHSENVFFDDHGYADLSSVQFPAQTAAESASEADGGQGSNAEANDSKGDLDSSKKKRHRPCSQKIGCDAKLTFKTFLVYEDYKLAKSASSRKRRVVFQQLRKDMAAKKAKSVRKIYVSLPKASVHANHMVSSRSGSSLKIHQDVRDKIFSLVSEGYTSAAAMQRQLKNFVIKELCGKNLFRPLSRDQAYFPRQRVIQKHIHAAILQGLCPNVDQDDLERTVERLKDERPGMDKFFLVKSSAEPENNETANDGENTGERNEDNNERNDDDTEERSGGDKEKNDDENGGSGDGGDGGEGSSKGKAGKRMYECLYEEEEEEEEEDVGAGEEESRERTLLLVHQTRQQRQLLQRYGKVLLLESTHRTARFTLPLYLLVVRTNVNFTPVAQIITEYENTAALTQALKIIKQWNPGLAPRIVQHDYSDCQYQAVHAVFPEATKGLGTSHVERAWTKWMKNSQLASLLSKKNCFSEQASKTLLSLLRNVAVSRTKEQVAIAVDSLKASEVYLNSPKLQQYLHRYWLCIPERWCAFNSGPGFEGLVPPDNKVESVFGSVKACVNLTSNASLSGLLRALLTEFLPQQWETYVKLNRDAANQSRTPDPCLPGYLRDRPPAVVEECFRSLVGAGYCRPEHIHKVGEGLFLVDGDTGQARHSVRLGGGSDFPWCGCADFAAHLLPCRHMMALLVTNMAAWSDLAPDYVCSPFLTIDRSVLTAQQGTQAWGEEGRSINRLAKQLASQSTGQALVDQQALNPPPPPISQSTGQSLVEHRALNPPPPPPISQAVEQLAGQYLAQQDTWTVQQLTAQTETQSAIQSICDSFASGLPVGAGGVEDNDDDDDDDGGGGGTGGDNFGDYSSMSAGQELRVHLQELNELSWLCPDAALLMSKAHALRDMVQVIRQAVPSHVLNLHHKPSLAAGVAGAGAAAAASAGIGQIKTSTTPAREPLQGAKKRKQSCKESAQRRKRSNLDSVVPDARFITVSTDAASKLAVVVTQGMTLTPDPTPTLHTTPYTHTGHTGGVGLAVSGVSVSNAGVMSGAVNVNVSGGQQQQFSTPDAWYRMAPGHPHTGATYARGEQLQTPESWFLSNARVTSSHLTALPPTHAPGHGRDQLHTPDPWHMAPDHRMPTGWPAPM